MDRVTSHWPMPLAIAAAIVVLAAVAASTAAGTLDPTPRSDLLTLGATLVATGLLGVSLVLASRRWTRGVGFGWQVVLLVAISLAIFAANVSVSAVLMFISTHDLNLLIVLTAFAAVITVPPALFIGADLSRRLRDMERAASSVADDLSTRVPVEGRDEIARFGAAFNAMAADLEEATARRDAMELARRELFAAISHDLRTPLSSMRVMVEALSDGVVEDDETRQRYLTTVGAEIEQMSALIDDLFELARLDSGELQLRAERIVLDEVVEAAVEAAAPGARLGGVSVRFVPRSGPVEVRADAQRLQRVLGNLLQNAVRHTPPDGSVVVTTETRGTDVVVEVADTGDGISPQDIPHVFDRFYRADKSRSRAAGGSGLGLTISRAIVEAHGGRIWVHHTTPNGTVMRFALPSTSEA